MKKILLVMILAAGFQQLKAQQLLKPLPDMKLSDGLSGNLFKPKSENPLAPFNQLNTDSSTHITTPQLDPNAIIVYSNMPVVKIAHSNIDHMPIYNPSASDMHYQILIKKVEVNPVFALLNEKITP
ncbi:MAG: hypothetical protein ACTHNW_10190 [Mucilaginibacter sp.]